MISAYHKLLRDKDKYLQMAPIQREAYLEGNCEYKRAKLQNNASTSNAQS